MADGRHFEKKTLNRDVFATVWPILTKFGTMTHTDPIQPTAHLNYELLENPRWRRPPYWKIEKLLYFSNCLTGLHKIWPHTAD